MIEDFISQVKTRGLARINRYEVVVPFPQPDPRGEMKRVANLFCDSVNLPGAAISTTPMKTFGEVREMPYEKIYDPVTMSFYVDSGLEIKKAFESWMELIYNTKTRTLGYYQKYIQNVDIYVKTVDGSTPYKITLHEAYPKAIQSVQLDTNGREVMKMTLTMQYKYWTSTTQDIIEAQTPMGFWGRRQSPQGIDTTEGYQFIEGGYPPDSFDPPPSYVITVE